jgi:hypothetical protein
MSNLAQLDRFIEEERKLYPKAGYRWKEKLALHHIIAFYLRPFNHRYIDGFTTTVYPNTDFPEGHRERPYQMVKIEFHENIHKWDRHDKGPIWSLKYGYPQILVLPFLAAAVSLGALWGLLGFGVLLLLLHTGLLACHLSRGEDGAPAKWSKILFYVLSGVGAASSVAGSIIGGGWWSLLWIGVLLFLSPWPFRSVWRRDAELRGYTGSLYAEWLKHGSVRKGIIDWYVKQFTSGNYFWMETRRELVYQELLFQVSRFTHSEAAFHQAWAWRNKRGMAYQKEAEPFRMMRSFMEKEGLLHG